MVTAQHSNTQYVAHEFVRQYYTMLHKDPTQMHRFYTCESRFTHGVSTNAKSEEPVCGQQAIYEKISQLNFRNCYAKIRSVDSHPTIAGGVVIQVSGELSNGGNAMRKFMQTFVLAQQDVKRYNVFNDIFRYQDEMFEDTEVEESANGTLESENGYASQEAAQVNQLDTIPDTDSEHEVTSEEESEEELAEAPAPAEDIPETYQYNDQEAGSTAAEEEFESDAKEEELVYDENEVEPLNEALEQPPSSHQEIPEQFEEVTYYEPVETREEAEPEAPAEELSEQEVVVVEDDGTEFKEEDDGTEFKEYDGNDIKVEEPPEEEEQVEPEPEPEPEEPQVFSWAGVTKKNTAAANTITPSPAPAKPPVKKLSPSQPPKKMPPQKREEPSIPKPEGGDEQRRRTPAPDNHQIFIGNLPIGVTEKDVREAFKEFGTILEVRLNPKNFGFIAFTGPEAPAKILSKPKNIVIHNNTINTEVKRSVSGVGRGGGGGGGRFQRGGDRDNNNRGGGRNDMNNRNSNRNPGSGNNGGSGGGGGGGPPNRPGKNSNSYNPKQPRQGGEEGRYERQPRDQKNPRNNQQREPRT